MKKHIKKNIGKIGIIKQKIQAMVPGIRAIGPITTLPKILSIKAIGPMKKRIILTSMVTSKGKAGERKEEKEKKEKEKIKTEKANLVMEKESRTMFNN